MPHHIVIVEDEPVTQARYNLTFTQEGIHFRYSERCTGLREIMGRISPVDLDCSWIST